MTASWVPEVGTSPDDVYLAVSGWTEDRGLALYPHQDEAIMELLAGSNVVLATPTGSGKSLVAVGAHAAALADDRVSFYTAPIKALVSEKFFDLCEVFGADNVGMLTGDAAVNADAPIICCTAEILANIALREGSSADVGLVVMDEFHFYAEPDRGWAWQVPLLALPQAQFLLMSATLGDTTGLREDLTRRNGRESVLVDQAERPVPLDFSYAMTPLPETLEELVSTGQAPVYVVHFTQAAAVEHATSLLTTPVAGRPQDELLERLAGVRFGAGFGKTLSKLLRKGIGVHHAGMLPRYRRLVEQLAQRGLLRVICGTDTLGVGINVPIRTVLFTGLAKFDGQRQRVLRQREFQQIAGRAGRAGFDTIGFVVVQAPVHVIANEAAKAKAVARQAAGKKRSKAQLKKPAEGTVVWSEQTFEKLVHGTPEPLVSRMKVDNAMILNVVARAEDAFPVLRRILFDNHETRRNQLRLARRALRLTRSLVHSGVLRRLEAPDADGRRYVLTEELPADFALNQPLAHFALAALDTLTPPEERADASAYTLEVVSVVEAVLEAPRQVLFAQQHEARGVAINELKADGVEYDERMALIEEITWPKPMAEQLEALYEIYRRRHPWLREDALDPKAIVREMYEQGMSFSDFCRRYQLARSEGLVLRYLTDAYRTFRHTLPDSVRTPEVEDLIEWLGETIRQTDSSLLDEWEALSDPDHVDPAAVGGYVGHHEPPPSPRPISQQERAFTVMVRNAMWARVDAVSRDDLDSLVRLERSAADRVEPARAVVMGRSSWDDALEAYYAEHDSVGITADSRSPKLLTWSAERGLPAGVDPEDPDARLWRLTQTIDDPAGDHDWVIEATADLDASDETGELVLQAVTFRRL
ncbi:DEAD/DEAH box helicase [Nocardioides insulae]|uniref:DEAD/DEAH box helicase n=1 Tax=Nocardioides insulae TaxID=394734 RepID=UPI00041B7730|nr:DEAD/DEAH box helicase [Nocardioides insulae]